MLTYDPHSTTFFVTPVHCEALFAFLNPLKAVRVAGMEVQMNMELPEEVLQRLAPVGFGIGYRLRGWDGKDREMYRGKDTIQLEGN